METLFTNKIFIKISTIFIGLLCLLAVAGIYGSIHGSSRGNNNVTQNVIAFAGHGEVKAVPDIASVYFTIEASDSTQVAASNTVNTKEKSILDFLKSSNIVEQDIKTEGYSSYPKYSNPTPCPIYYGTGSITPCTQAESKIIGYTVSESVTATIRKVDDASKIIDGVNKIGVTNMSGPNFSIDNEDSLKTQARKIAIDDAKARAKELANQLGVSLGNITSFSESGNYPGPIMYAKALSASSAATPAPAQLPTGQSTISSDVTITYEIK